jgi:hypothetical protein
VGVDFVKLVVPFGGDPIAPRLPTRILSMPP